MEPSFERTRSILIVDDEEGIRHGLRNFFHKKGFFIHEAFDFRSALTAVKSHPIDIAVIDIRLKDGKDLHYLEAEVTTVIIPWHRITFIEIVPSAEIEEVITFVREE